MDMICEYAGGGREPQMAKEQGVPKEELPFFNGKPYMISSDSMLPEGFARLFAQKNLTAAVFLPVEVNGHAGMYLCFCESEKKKKWENADVKFINDVKRIIQTILTKRITKNSLASSYASLEAILENVGCAIYVKRRWRNFHSALSAYRMRPRQKTVCSGKFIPRRKTDGLTATAPISSGWMEEK